MVDDFGGIANSSAFPSLYLDEDLPRDAVDEFAYFGYEAIYARTVLPSSTPDDDHLRYATEHGSIMVTRNRRDFVLLHHTWLSWSRMWGVSPLPEHPGILITPGT
jgi:hypothetical protein